MKINLDFYKEKQEKLLPIDEQILENINNNSKENYKAIIEKDTRIEVVMALSEIRENILNWYTFKENATILEIEPNYGEITGLLCDKASKVVGIENSLKKAEAIQKRHENKENLEIIVGNIENIELQEKFDYITLIGTIENLSNIFTGSIEEYIELIKKFLKEDGKIILAIDNKIGMKYFSKTDSTGISIENHNGKNLIGLKELKKIIKDTKLIENKIYYPMPDYKFTNAIFTDEKLLSKNNLSRNIIYNSEDTIKFYEENNAYKQILEEDKEIFKMFANSYLIEIGKENNQEKNIKFISFSNIRKPEYRIKTIVENENVYKYAINDNSNKHIENIKRNIDIMKKCNLNTVDSYEENRIVSKYTNALTLDKVIINLINENKSEEAINIIKKFKNEIETKLTQTNSENNVFDKYNIKYEKTNIEKMKFIEEGLWDLIFQNCFYIDEKFYFYDQEWQEEKIPIDFILYRAIKYFSQIKEYIQDEKLYEIMGIEQENIELFDELDDKLQLIIRDENVWKIHTQGMEIIDLKRKELTANHQINLLNIENAKDKTLLEEKNKEIQELKEQLSSVYNSKSWKITKPLRTILKLGKKQERMK